jgi:hypothetical protein
MHDILHVVICYLEWTMTKFLLYATNRKRRNNKGQGEHEVAEDTHEHCTLPKREDSKRQ